MSPYVQGLLLAGGGQLGQQVATIGANNSLSPNQPNTAKLVLQPGANFVWIVYEIRWTPPDPRIQVQMEGPNVAAGLIIAGLQPAEEGAWLAFADAPLTLNILTTGLAAVHVTARYVQLTSAVYAALTGGGS